MQGQGEARKDYAKCHGRLRGNCDQNDHFPPLHENQTDSQASHDYGASEDEGLVALVQSRTCRRKLLNKIFNNPASTLGE